MNSSSYTSQLKQGQNTFGSDKFGEGSYRSSDTQTPSNEYSFKPGIYPSIDKKRVDDILGALDSDRMYQDPSEDVNVKMAEIKESLYDKTKAEWMKNIYNDVPMLQNVRETVYPLHRAAALAKKYNPGTQKVKDKIQREQLISLVLQHLHVKGYNQTRAKLEEESKIVTPKHNLNKSVMLYALYNSIKNSEMVYEIAVDDKAQASGNDHLKSIGLNSLMQETDDSMKIYEDEEVKKLAGTQFGEISLNDNSDKNMNLNTIVYRLTAFGIPVGDFDKSVYMFLTTFTTPEKFFLKLMERLDIPENFAPENNAPPEKYKTSVMTKVANVIKTWIDTCAMYYDPPVKRALIKIMEEHIGNVEGAVLALMKGRIGQLKQSLEASKGKLINAVIKKNCLIEPLKIDEGATETNSQQIAMTGTMTKAQLDKLKQQANMPKMTNDDFFRKLTPNINFIDLDVDVIVEQFTYLEASIFYQLQPSEFFGQAWAKAKLRHKAQNILASTQMFNFISSFFVNLILDTADLEQRIQLVKKIIQIGIKAHSIHNYDLLYSIAGSVGDAAVFRMKQTWAVVDQDPSKEKFNELSGLFQKNYAGYRKEIENISQKACIPFIGTSLTDYTFLDDGNPDMNGDKINIDKKMRLYQCIQSVIKYKDIKYNIVAIPQIITYIKSYYFDKGILTDEKAKYEKSLKTEARVKK